jgi:signal transduction histidine kinase
VPASCLPRPSLLSLAPSWVRLSIAFLFAVPLAELLFGAMAPDSPLQLVVFAGRLTIEAAASFWASRRLDLPPRTRRALRVLGFSSLLPAVVSVVQAVGGATGRYYPDPVALSVMTAASYLLGCGQLLLPMAALRPGEWRVFALDALAGIGGLAVLVWVLVTRPLQATAVAPAPALMVLAYGVGSVAQIAAINLVVLRGLAVPSRRALWLFIAGQAAYMPVLLLAQYFEAGQFTSATLIDFLYFGSVVFTLLSAVAFRYDEMREGAPKRLLDAFSTVNPFVLVAPVLMSGALVVALQLRAEAQVAPLAYALIGLVLLLVTRTLLSALERARLLDVEAGEILRVQQAKNEAIGRLAGGVAHEFNNLMQIVIGRADLAAAHARLSADVHEDLSRIRVAGERAAALTRQLLQFSGRQYSSPEAIDIAAVLRQSDAIQTTLGPLVRLELELRPVPLALVDPRQLEQLMFELASNARDAMPEGGLFRVDVRGDLPSHALRTNILEVPPGRYVVIDVSDTGAGLPPGDPAQVFEPFFTTKLASKGPGLGLSAVYGIVAAHQGGIGVESAPGFGTTFRICLPVLGEGRRSNTSGGVPWPKIARQRVRTGRHGDSSPRVTSS